MRISKESIIETMKNNHAKPPFTVWSIGFKDILDDIPQGGLPNGQHGKRHESLDSAASEYLELNSVPVGRDLLITMPSRIMDSRNEQVYP